LRNGFRLFICSLHEAHPRFTGLGQMSGAFGIIEVAHAKTGPGEITIDYTVTLALFNGRDMGLYLPSRVAQLPRERMLDWLEAQIDCFFGIMALLLTWTLAYGRVRTLYHYPLAILGD
jgi:hypothetical protein